MLFHFCGQDHVNNHLSDDLVVVTVNRNVYNIYVF